MFENFWKWESAVITFLLTLHLLTCGWIYVYKTKTFYERATIEFSDYSDLAIYVDSIYLMTTTISTVGYGDFKGHISDTGEYAHEMLYLYFAIFFGILLFSMVKD